MERRGWIRSIVSMTLAAAALGVAAVVLKTAHEVRSSASELPRQLAAAKREGIATTAAELAAERLADSAHNAAPRYDDAIRLLKELPSKGVDDLLQLSSKILDGTPSEAERSAAHAKLLRFGPALEAALLGSVRAHCAFAPIWDEGSGYPQLKSLSTLTRLLATRAAVDRDLSDLFAAERMANHIGEAPVLEGEQLQSLAILHVCKAAWILAKAQPDNALTCKTLVEDLPGIQLDKRADGELLRSLFSVESLGTSSRNPLRDLIALPGSPQLTDAYQAEVVRSVRRIHTLTKSAKSWNEIEDGLSQIETQAKADSSVAGHVLSVLVGPWAQTARAARKAQEKRAVTVQALEALTHKQPDYTGGSHPTLA